MSFETSESDYLDEKEVRREKSQKTIDKTREEKAKLNVKLR